jgi:excisionase family DNA binding protein
MKIEYDFPDVVLDAIADRVVERLQGILEPNKGIVDEVLDVPGVAQYLGVTEQFIYDRTALKELPYFKAGRYLRFKRSAIDRWIESQSVPATSPLSRKLKVLKGGGRI